MTAADLGTTIPAELLTLCAGNEHATELIRGAQQQLSGADLEAHLLAHAQPALFADGLAKTMYQAMTLEDRITFLRNYLDDQAAIPEMVGVPFDRAVEQLTAEILDPLHRLVTGRPPCAASLNGNLAGGLDAIHPADGPRVAGREFCIGCWNAGTTRLLSEIARAS